MAVRPLTIRSLSAFREPINTDPLSDPIDRGEHDFPVTFSFEGLLLLLSINHNNSGREAEM